MATAGRQWAGYDYPIGLAGKPAGLVQGTKRNRYGRRADAESAPGRFTFRTVSAGYSRKFASPDIVYQNHVPRLMTALMRSPPNCEPFADHRLVELALRQPSEPKSRARRVIARNWQPALRRPRISSAQTPVTDP